MPAILDRIQLRPDISRRTRSIVDCAGKAKRRRRFFLTLAFSQKKSGVALRFPPHSKSCRLFVMFRNLAKRLGVRQPAAAFWHSPYLALAGFVAISRAIGSSTRQTFSTSTLCPAAFG